jgi:release factor glutamine methyltransferase
MMMVTADVAISARPGGAVVTVAGARQALAGKLRAAGIDTPELDARILVGHALSLEHSALAAVAARILTDPEKDGIAALARRRLAGEPVARIVGRKEFWSLELRINAATLVPRPETETVVEAALAAIDVGGERARPLRIADLGTGSGVLLLALLAELPNAAGIGTDNSLPALVVARDNARRLRLGRATFVACDMAAALAGPFDLIVSNPPYIASGDIAALAPEVREFDPWGALDGGPDGLDFYRMIAATVPTLLRPGGALVVELGSGQASMVTGLFSAAGLALSPPRPDLHGVPRAVLARNGSSGMTAEHWPPAKTRQGNHKKSLGISAGTD